jgi:drug/metabolite transporter (DMT)-like permease
MNQLYRGAILILISASSFALMPIFAVYAYRGGTTVSTLLFLRFSLAAIIFFIYILTQIKKITFNRSGVRSSLFLGAVLLTLQSILYFESLKYIPTSLQALLFYTYPIFVTLLSFLIYKERPSIRLTASIALSIFGLCLVLGTSFETINFLGALMALGAAAVYSVYMTISNHIT